MDRTEGQKRSLDFMEFGFDCLPLLSTTMHAPDSVFEMLDMVPEVG